MKNKTNDTAERQKARVTPVKSLTEEDLGPHTSLRVASKPI